MENTDTVPPLTRIAVAVRRVANAMGSRHFATAVMAAWTLLLVVWIVPFQFYRLPVDQLQRIMYREPFFLVVYAGLVVSTLGCMLPRMRTSWRHARRLPAPSSRPRSGAAHAESHRPFGRVEALQALRRAGYRTVVEGDGWTYGVANRYAPLGNLVFHLAIVLLMAAFGLSTGVAGGFSAQAVLAEGESFDPSRPSFTSVEGTLPPDVVLPAFTVTRVTPEFHEDILLFTRLDCDISHGDERRVVSLARPWHPDLITTVGIADFGYAPQVTVSVGEGSSSTGVYRIKAFPSGTADTFDVQTADGRTYRVRAVIYSDYVDRDGTPGSASYNLREPRLLLSVWRVLSTDVEKIRVRDQLVALGEALRFDDVSLTVDAIRHFGVFRVSRSPEAPLVGIAFALVVLGAAVRLLAPRRQALLLDAGDQVAISVTVDTYRTSEAAVRRLLQAFERTGRRA